MNRESENEGAMRKRDTAVFALAASFFLLCCMAMVLMNPPEHMGVRLPFVLYHGVLWFTGLFLFVLFPSGLGFKKGAAVIIGLSFVVRILFLGRFCSDGFTGIADVSQVVAALCPRPLVTGIFNVFIDLAVIACLMMILEARGRCFRWALVYALNPLVLIGVAGQDCATGVFCLILLAAVLLHDRKARGWMFSGIGIAGDPASGILNLFSVLLFLPPFLPVGSLILLIPFAVLTQRLSFLVLSLSVGWAFPESLSHGYLDYVAVWLPFILIFGLEIRCFFKRRTVRTGFEIPKNVSVIIPVKNEEVRIRECITCIRENPWVHEVIVVDGASTDNTVDLAIALGAKVIRHDAAPENGGGRGGQILRGIAEAEGDVVAVVHADIRFEPGLTGRMLEILGKNPQIIGGAAGTVFDDPSLAMKLVESLNILRAVFFKISFGDQIQFFRRKEVQSLELFPDIPLMEDVEFSLRLQNLGQTVYLFGASRVSVRRWKRKGLSNALTVLRYFFSYVIQRFWKTPDAVKMYRSYYGIRDNETKL